MGASVCTEGTSLKSIVVSKPGREIPVKDIAFGQWSMNGYMSYSLFTRLDDGSEVRYTEWVDYDEEHYRPKWDTLKGRELYNHTADPGEDVSIHDVEGLASTVKILSAKLRAGWRAVPTSISEPVSFEV